MTPAIQTQKTQLQLALHWITIIENCDRKIDAGNHVNYYKSVRAEAVTEYIETVAGIVEASIEAEKPPNIFDDVKATIDKIVADHNKNLKNFYNIH